jgi:hypothetical protein
MLRLPRRWYVGALVLAPLVLVLALHVALSGQRPLPHLTERERDSISRKGVPREEVERVFGPPSGVMTLPGGGTPRTLYVYEARIDDLGWHDLFVLSVEYDEAGTIASGNQAFGHEYRGLEKALKWLSDKADLH